MNPISCPPEDLQQQNFQRQMAMMQKLMPQFEGLLAKIQTLTKNAAHDPAAQARLEKLEEAWHNGLGQDVKKMQASAKKTLELATAYRRSLLHLTAGKPAPMVAPAPPAQAMKKRKRVRQFA